MEIAMKRIYGAKERLREHIVAARSPLSPVYLPGGYKKGNELPGHDAGWQPFCGVWGGTADAHVWFRVAFTVPDCAETRRFELTVSTDRGGGDATNPQFLLYEDGRVVQGLDVNHRSAVFAPGAHEVIIYAYTGTDVDKPLALTCELAEIDLPTRALYYDLSVPFDIAEYSDTESETYAELLNGMNEAVDMLDFRRPYTPAYYDGLRRMSERLSALYGRRGGQTVSCIGHSHIDCAWLWTLAQTKEKAQRTFSTALRLMDRYPEYIFMASQPLLYKFVKEEAPDVYEDVKRRVREGRWEPEGAMWVEADCNLISGESMVRQIMFGKRFFRDEFGTESAVLWLPDVFGYSAAMPQILKKSGVDTFVTSKISWNDTDRMPHDAFEWKGIDGTGVFTYFLTAQDKRRGQPTVQYTTYVGHATPRQIAGTRERFTDKALCDGAILTYGYGDGGGGPTEDDLETLRRTRRGALGCPATVNEKAGDFLARVKREATAAGLPVWSGELYLEYHRGTYTSAAANKRGNRRAEFGLMYAELLSAAAWLLRGDGYPAAALDAVWERTLTNQFHDILPGSSIRQVYEDCAADYARIEAELAEIVSPRETAVADTFPAGTVVAFNPHSFTASGIVEADGTVYYAADVPPKGYRALAPAGDAGAVRIGDRQLENDFFRLTFDDGWALKSVFDKRAGRELLREGSRGNALVVYDDGYNAEYDAWEIKPYAKRVGWTMDDVSAEPFDDGERAGFVVRRRYLTSGFVQRVTLYRHTDRIDFVTEADWREPHSLVKAEFDFDINTDKATFDIQFGCIERPTHRNTSWDEARFEVCSHKYVDLSEGGYGAALLNDCKYGSDVLGSKVGLTLIKTATYPNPVSDIGRHTFTYSLYPHAGDFRHSDTVRQAYLVNAPLRARVSHGAGKGKAPAPYSFIGCETPGVFVETVKRSEDGKAVIARVYETFNARRTVRLTTGFDFSSAHVCDLTEKETGRPETEARAVTFEIRPFEIVTLKFVP